MNRPDLSYWRSRAIAAESALRTLAEDERLSVGVRNFAMARLPADGEGRVPSSTTDLNRAPGMNPK